MFLQFHEIFDDNFETLSYQRFSHFLESFFLLNLVGTPSKPAFFNIDAK